MPDDNRPMTTDARALIEEGRRHDEAMTDGPWVSERDDPEYGEVYSADPYKLVAQTGRAPVAANATGIAWLRSNLRALLDGCSAALDEVEGKDKTIERLVARIAATDAPEDIDATLASLEAASAQIATLRTELGEAKLVIEQQDRDLERLRTALVAMRDDPDLRTDLQISAILEGTP
jgi:hypothetical protein